MQPSWVAISSKLSFLEGKLIGVCSLLTSMRELGSVFVRVLCSANRPRMRPPCGVAQGFRLVEVFSRGVCAGSGVEQNDENAEGEENCDSSNAPRNMRRLSGF